MKSFELQQKLEISPRSLKQKVMLHVNLTIYLDHWNMRN